jgi:hypothetical protein
MASLRPYRARNSLSLKTAGRLIRPGLGFIGTFFTHGFAHMDAYVGNSDINGNRK